MDMGGQQLDLFKAVRPRRKPLIKFATLDERFAKFHGDNPHVYAALRRVALEQARAGATRLSIAKLAEDLRADPNLRTTGDDFRLNNSFRRPYAELLMRDEPSLVGLFELRAPPRRAR